jgi:predicted phosphoribosyltransferase
VFRDRAEAGRRLAVLLRKQFDEADDVVVLGIPRGGVVVAAPVAAALGAPLDVIVPRKIGAPGEPELAVGALALADGEEIKVFDDEMIARLAVSRSYLEAEVVRQRREIERREDAYREGRAPVAVAGRTVVIVDDGIATGMTARAAAEAAARRRPKEVVLAAPVAPAETKLEFQQLGLRIEVLETPTPFMAVGQFYLDFEPVEDDDVRTILRRSAPA